MCLPSKYDTFMYVNTWILQYIDRVRKSRELFNSRKVLFSTYKVCFLKKCNIIFVDKFTLEQIRSLVTD